LEGRNLAIREETRITRILTKGGMGIGHRSERREQRRHLPRIDTDVEVQQKQTKVGKGAFQVEDEEEEENEDEQEQHST
jgi:hypothetical protein